MKRKIWNILSAAILTASLVAGAMPMGGLRVQAAGDIKDADRKSVV